MDVEEELAGFLGSFKKVPGRPRLDGTPRKVREEDPTQRERNAEIVLSHFGFGSGPHFWPTLDQIAEHYPEISTRERIRQIIDRTYSQRRPASPLPVATRTAAVLEERTLWLESEYLEELQERGLCGPLEHAIGLLNYLQSQGLAENYSIRLPNLASATRSLYDYSEERFIVSDQKARALEKDLTAARKMPGQVGLARLSAVTRNGASVDSEGLAELLRLSPDAWTGTHDDELWFFFEDRENVLVNLASKIFAIVDSVSVTKLAALLTNALYRRANRHGYPPPELVERWISQSRYFTVLDGMVTYNEKAGELTDIERVISRFAKGQGAIRWPEVRDHLRALDFGDPLITSSVYHSPLLLVDRSGGRGNFTFTLISEVNSAPVHQPDRYGLFLAKLAALGSTDREGKGLSRREQAILADWVFDGQPKANCAVCGRTFARRALVVAHKKKRSRCSDTERLDPHIVFPLCTFGCDYLYEHGYIIVRNGCVIHGRRATGDTEHERAVQLVGLNLDTKWIQGPAHYFDNS
ncbi:hypothetical protein [Acetobacter oryzifermentans]|uniref:C2H2-type domain-containing protein n=1 Tax=Acetobacter oryzifermentans TaxID=1633874 RepID=A0ABM6ANC1_9PROT|nr:hypothetical protein [Acetobacter oryzifermentans]ANA15283.1 hypothetical protein WG31_14205 [Acetobacter oryzifermentans]